MVINLNPFSFVNCFRTRSEALQRLAEYRLREGKPGYFEYACHQIVVVIDDDGAGRVPADDERTIINFPLTPQETT